jgi:spore coat polysaccharide biosynthesis protein SpsF
MSGRAIIVLQARLASRRLPEKALALIGGRPILAHCLDRLQAGGAAQVVLATTENREDDTLAAVAIGQGVPVVRGPDADVLRRFLIAADRFDATYIIRATADNPAVDIDAPRRVLQTLVGADVDYVTESGLPYGAAVEAVTVDALHRADAMAASASDREHVTSLVRRDRLFQALEIPAPRAVQRPDLRLTVDTLTDLAYMRHVLSAFALDMHEPPLSAIVAAADALMPTSEAVPDDYRNPSGRFPAAAQRGPDRGDRDHA